MADRYWVGGGSSTNWDATGPTNWSATDGGANDASVPAAGDDVFMKSSADCVLNVHTAAINSFDMTGYTGTFSGNKVVRVAPTSGTVVCLLAGTWTNTGGVALEPVGVATTINFTSGGKTIDNISPYDGTGTGIVSQQDALNVTVAFNIYNGTWNTNGYTITCGNFIVSSGCDSFNFTNSTLTATDSLGWDCDVSATIISTGSTIASAGKFSGGGKTYNVVTLSGNSVALSGDNTFFTLNVNTAGLATGLIFDVGSIQTVTNFTTNGYADNLAKISSSTAGSHFHLTTASAQISVDYMSIKDSIADQANTWYAGANSTDVSGNDGWIFTAPPTVVEPSTLALAATLHPPAVVIDRTVTPATFELAAALLAPEILIAVVVTPDTFALALTQHAPSLRLDYTVQLDSALQLGLALQAPTVFPIVTVTPESLALAVALLSPVVVIDVTVIPDTFALALTQYAPVVSVEVTVFPAVLELEATLHAPEVITRYTAIPPFMQKDLIDPYSGGAWLWLCEIAVPGQAKVWIARNTENISYDGEDYEKFNFQIGEQVFSGDGSIPRVTLQIFQDVNRVIEDMVNETEGALGAGVKLIRVNEKFLDVPVAALEADYENLASESDSEWVTFTLGVPNPLTQRFPLRIDSSDACPWATPSLFKGPECQYTGGDSFCTGTYNDCYTKGNAVHWGAELGLDPNVVRI